MKYIYILALSLATLPGARAGSSAIDTTQYATHTTTTSSETTYGAGAGTKVEKKKTRTAVTHKKTKVDSAANPGNDTPGEASASDANFAPVGRSGPDGPNHTGSPTNSALPPTP